MLTGQQIGPFSVEKELGSGAMGSVFRARYTKTGQRVAIKVIAPGLAASGQALARFEREADILKQLNHPNIVRIYAHGKFRGTPFYAMEYIKGESLDRVMARRGRISWEEAVTMGKQLCAALHHAHQQGIIHRDLKPSNLMVLEDGTLKLTDFGIAKDMDVTQLTSANCTVGTAAYMSPEQCRGERDLSPKSDLYSLGILLYELVTGRKPFLAETPMDMFLLHVQGQFERPSRLVLDLPVWFDTLICQLLEKKPEQRPLNAAAVGEALDRIQEKVEAQKSAGVDLVRSRAAERPNELARLDADDKDAARTLLGKKRRARKKKGAPFYARVWFKAAVLSAALVALGYLLFGVLLKRPTPDQLYDRASALMATGQADDRQEAREGAIADYLRYYPDRDDAQAKKIRAWADEMDAADLERRLRGWERLNRPSDNDREKAAREALKLEDEVAKKPAPGKFDEIIQKWHGLVPLKDSQGTEHLYGLLADQHEQAARRQRWDYLTRQLDGAAAALKAKEPKEAATIYQDVFARYENSKDADLVKFFKVNKKDLEKIRPPKK